MPSTHNHHCTGHTHGYAQYCVFEEFKRLKAQAGIFDPDELMGTRLALRLEEENRAVFTLKENYTWEYNAERFKQAKSNIANLLGEDRTETMPRFHRKNFKQTQKEVPQRELPQKKRAKEWER